jgi:hypothetical protein
MINYKFLFKTEIITLITKSNLSWNILITSEHDDYNDFNFIWNEMK